MSYQLLPNINKTWVCIGLKFWFWNYIWTNGLNSNILILEISDFPVWLTLEVKEKGTVYIYDLQFWMPKGCVQF